MSEPSQELVDAAKERGFSYVGESEHGWDFHDGTCSLTVHPLVGLPRVIVVFEGIRKQSEWIRSKEAADAQT